MSGERRDKKPTDRRCRARVPTARQVGCRLPASPIDGMLFDLSADGCRIRMQAPGFIQPGSTIVVQLADEDEIAGQVVWLEAGDVGLRFYEPLDALLLARALGEREPEEPIRFDAAANVRLII